MRGTIVTILLAITAAPGITAQEPQATSNWEVSLGTGVLASPSYPGAEEYRITPFPLTQVSYRSRIYLGPNSTGTGLGLGAYAIRTERFRVATEVGFLDSRPASRADALAGMRNRDFVPTAAVSMSYRLSAFQGVLSVTQGLNNGAGLLGAAGLSYSRQVGSRVGATVGVGATFANARQMRWDFGVSAAEAARRQALIAAGDDRLEADESGPYRPKAGLRQVGTSLSLMYAVSSHWAVLGFGGLDWLSDQATASPLVRRREQVSGGIGLGYRF
jgi:outer membrane scaffolding protein for murein synthesis (MipA/OmpV family)